MVKGSVQTLLQLFAMLQLAENVMELRFRRLCADSIIFNVLFLFNALTSKVHHAWAKVRALHSEEGRVNGDMAWYRFNAFGRAMHSRG